MRVVRLTVRSVGAAPAAATHCATSGHVRSGHVEFRSCLVQVMSRPSRATFRSRVMSRSGHTAFRSRQAQVMSRSGHVKFKACQAMSHAGHVRACHVQVMSRLSHVTIMSRSGHVTVQVMHATLRSCNVQVTSSSGHVTSRSCHAQVMSGGWDGRKSRMHAATGGGARFVRRLPRSPMCGSLPMRRCTCRIRLATSVGTQVKYVSLGPSNGSLNFRSFARTPHPLSRLTPRRATTQRGGERYGRLSRGRTNSGLCLLTQTRLRISSALPSL